jgi:hypothetical protein
MIASLHDFGTGALGIEEYEPPALYRATISLQIKFIISNLR